MIEKLKEEIMLDVLFKEMICEGGGPMYIAGKVVDILIAQGIIPVWRPISEAENGQKVLATDGSGVDYGYWNNGELWDELGNDWNGYTHFMPLPLPPTGEK